MHSYNIYNIENKNISERAVELLKNIDMTVYNIDITNRFISQTSDEDIKKAMTERNKQRECAIKLMRAEIENELSARP